MEVDDDDEAFAVVFLKLVDLFDVWEGPNWEIVLERGWVRCGAVCCCCCC